ncbi:MAG: hypothetical protein K2V38_05715, partial [Gemmataceae bacterium]|nr:hypothetical protein [Gemmataceae bacterium]
MPAVARLCRALAVALLAFTAVALARAADEQDVPPAADVKEAIETLRDVFDKDYKAAESDPAAKRALARKLFEGGRGRGVRRFRHTPNRPSPAPGAEGVLPRRGGREHAGKH